MPKEEEEAQDGQVPSAMSGGRVKVLLVDDEPFIISAVSRILDQAGIETFACSNWSEINSTIRDMEPDVILLDYNMPLLKGDSICTILKRNTVNRDMRIFLFSSEDESLLRSVTFKCGADGYIPKSTPWHLLAERINELASSTPV